MKTSTAVVVIVLGAGALAYLAWRSAVGVIKDAQQQREQRFDDAIGDPLSMRTTTPWSY